MLHFAKTGHTGGGGGGEINIQYFLQIIVSDWSRFFLKYHSYKSYQFYQFFLKFI